MIIKNSDALATTGLREQALAIIEAGISSVLPLNIMKSAVRYDEAERALTIQGSARPMPAGRIFVIGGGKAAGLMAEAIEEIIGPESIVAGAVNCKGGRYQTRKIRVVTAGHPIPDRRGVSGTGDMLALKERYSIGRGDMVICLISGGGSALMPLPAEGVSLRDKQIITELLLACGAEIGEVNAVRKHLSGIKGGRLGSFYSPATVVSLILSDVIGNDLSVIASGPTYPDPSTFADACGALEKYKLTDRAPKAVTALLKKGCLGRAPETPKTLENCHNYIIGDSRLALEAMRIKAGEMGFSPYIITDRQKGDTAAAARLRANEIITMKYAGHDALIIGGETTLKLPASPGRGGRNQHYAAVSLLAMERCPSEWVVASVGTDGSDFLPDVAGGIVDRSSLDKAKAEGIDIESYIERYDSNTLLDRIGGCLVITGETGTNAGDAIIYLLGAG